MEASTPVLKISVKSVKKINIDDCLPNASDSSSDWSNHSVNLSIKEEIDELSPVLKQTHISNSPAKIEYGLDGSSMPLQTRKRSRMEKWDYNQESREEMLIKKIKELSSELENERKINVYNRKEIKHHYLLRKKAEQICDSVQLRNDRLINTINKIKMAKISNRITDSSRQKYFRDQLKYEDIKYEDKKFILDQQKPTAKFGFGFGHTNGTLKEIRAVPYAGFGQSCKPNIDINTFPYNHFFSKKESVTPVSKGSVNNEEANCSSADIDVKKQSDIVKVKDRGQLIREMGEKLARDASKCLSQSDSDDKTLPKDSSAVSEVDDDTLPANDTMINMFVDKCKDNDI